MRDTVMPAMATVRAACDALEGEIAADLWPLPTYREMLFVSRRGDPRLAVSPAPTRVEAGALVFSPCPRTRAHLVLL